MLRDEVIAPRPRVMRSVLATWSIADWVVSGYLALLFFAALQGSGPLQSKCVWGTSALLTLHALVVFSVRAGMLGHGRMAGLVYRLVVYGAFQASYFLLRPLLQTARSVSFDPQLCQLDIRLFGVEPTLWLDQFVTSARTEWFAFFYFSYFVLLAIHILPMLMASRRPQLLTEFGLAVFFVFCTAHLFYFVVPGYGPHRYLAGSYQHALPQGRFYDIVVKTVSAGGALKDIFPSLHTAGPTMIAVFSYRHRALKPFKYTWPIAAFFAANIIGATIFLRWHYVIDVAAGLTLAFSAVKLGAVIGSWEHARRAELSIEPAWPMLRRWIPEPEMAPRPTCCPRCGADSVRVLYFGAPMKMCSGARCPMVWGAFSFLPLLVSSRTFVRYEGSYFQGMRFWLTTRAPRRETPPD